MQEKKKIEEYKSKREEMVTAKMGERGFRHLIEDLRLQDELNCHRYLTMDTASFEVITHFMTLHKLFLRCNKLASQHSPSENHFKAK